MLLQDYDWKVGDKVLIKSKRIGNNLRGEIICILLNSNKKGEPLIYVVKLSDTESITVSARNLSPIR